MIYRLLTIIFFPLVSFAQGYYTFSPQNKYEKSGEFYDIDSLRKVKINFYNSNYHQILDSTYYANPSYRLPAFIDIGGYILDSVAIKYKGNSTYVKIRSSVKKPLSIDVNDLVGGQKLFNYKNIKLANAYFDPTFTKEILATKIYKKYLPTYEANLLEVQLQGSYTGLFVNQEVINKQFIEKHFGEKNGILFKCDPTGAKNIPDLKYYGPDSVLYYGAYELKSDHGWKELIRLMDILNNDPSKLESILNVDRVLWYFAVNHAVLNLDAYNTGPIHNYYLYQTKDSLFQIIPWDLSESFVNSFWDPKKGAGVASTDPYGSGKTQPPLLNYVLNNALNRKVYTAHLKTIAIESLDTNWFSSNIKSIQSRAYNVMAADIEKPFSNSQFYANVYQPETSDSGMYVAGKYYAINTAAIIPIVQARKNYLLNHPAIASPSPTISNLNVSNGRVTASISNANYVELMATNSEYSSKFKAFSMVDNGTLGDVIAGDGIYTAVLPYLANNQDIKFYIRAQNNNALSLSPERAEYEFHIYSPKTGASNIKELKNEINIFPNPTTGIVKLYIDENERIEIKIKVFSSTGELVFSGINKKEIDLFLLSNGIYFLEITNANGERQLLKLIKAN